MTPITQLARRFLVTVALLLSACPSASLPTSDEPDPVLAVVAYRDALAEGRPRDAFRWIHPDAREGLDEAGFEALYTRHRDALVAQADELVKLAKANPPTQRAKVATDRGDVLVDRTPAGWRLVHPVARPGSE